MRRVTCVTGSDSRPVRRLAAHPAKFDPSFPHGAILLTLPQCRLRGRRSFYNVGPCGTYAEYEGKYFMQERGFICQLPHAGSRAVL